MMPPISIATKMPLPAFAVAAPKDVNSPVPTIIAAVSNTAVIFPIVLLLEPAALDIVRKVNQSCSRRLLEVLVLEVCDALVSMLPARDYRRNTGRKNKHYDSVQFATRLLHSANSAS